MADPTGENFPWTSPKTLEEVLPDTYLQRKKTKKGGIGSMATTSSSSKPEGAEAEEEEEPTLESDVSPTL